MFLLTIKIRGIKGRICPYWSDRFDIHVLLINVVDITCAFFIYPKMYTF